MYKTTKQRKIEAKVQKQVDAFNEKYSPGDAVRVKKDNGETVSTVVAAPACIIGNNAVAWFNDICGCYCISRVIK